MVSKRVPIMVYRLGMKRPAADEEHVFWCFGTGEDHQKISKVHFGFVVLACSQPIASGVRRLTVFTEPFQKNLEAVRPRIRGPSGKVVATIGEGQR